MVDILDLKKHIRNVNDFQIPGIKIRDITRLIETHEPFKQNLQKANKDDRTIFSRLRRKDRKKGFYF